MNGKGDDLWDFIWVNLLNLFFQPWVKSRSGFYEENVFRLFRDLSLPPVERLGRSGDCHTGCQSFLQQTGGDSLAGFFLWNRCQDKDIFIQFCLNLLLIIRIPECGSERLRSYQNLFITPGGRCGQTPWYRPPCYR